MNHFTNCSTVGEVKKAYRELCLKHHPDISGYNSTREMQNINAAYLRALQTMDGQISQGTDNKEHKYTYNDERERDLIHTMAELIRARLPDHITVEIVGIYIWVSGTRRNDRDAQKALKSLKLYWHSKREKWYWKPEDYHTRYNGRLSYDDLRAVYGYEEVEHRQPHLALAG